MDKIKKYQSNSHIIFHGNALDILPTIDDQSIDLIFVDPPYNIGKKYVNFVDKWPSDKVYIEWCKLWIDLCIEKLSPSGSMYVMASTQSMPYIDIYIREKLSILSRIIWYYDSSGVQAKNYYGSRYEPILFCVKNPDDYTFNAEQIMVEAKTGAKRKLIDYRKDPPEPYNSKKVPGNVWEFVRVRYRMPEYEKHPTQKPEELLTRIIKASSNPGDIILDPFAGSFTTCAVAGNLNRRSIGIELAEEYIKIGLRRVGISSSYNGEILKPPSKKYNNKNKNDPLQLDLKLYDD